MAAARVSTQTDEAIVEAVRSDVMIGDYSNSRYENCYSDAELVSYVRQCFPRHSLKGLVREMRQIEADKDADQQVIPGWHY